MEEHSQLLKKQLPFAPIKIFYSKATRIYFGNDNSDRDDFGSAVKGIEKVLMEAHLPYGFIPDVRFSSAGLIGCELLILPNVACLSDQEVQTIKKYVEDGGTLLATYTSSLYDENGQARKDFALADLFGCSFQNEIIDTQKDAYQIIAQRTSLLKGFENTSILNNGGNTLLCRENGSGAVTLTKLVPPVNNQPPEKAWREKLEIESPVMVSNSYGKGKVVYFANQTDKLYYNTGHQDYGNMLKNTIEDLQPNPMIKTNAPESVHINITKNEAEKCYIISLINITSAPVRPIRTIIPVSDITVDLNLQDEEKISDSRILINSDAIEMVNNSDNVLNLKVKKLDEFVSVAVFYE
jgi:hypothetical protein